MRDIIKLTVQKLTKKYKTNDPFKLVDYLDITLIEKPLGETWGAYMYLHRNKVIFINSDLPYHNKKAVLAHELGHALLHYWATCYFKGQKTYFLTSKLEREANIFAAYLLIHNNIFKNYEGETLQYISLAENIPIKLLEIKASYDNTLANFYEC